MTCVVPLVHMLIINIRPSSHTSSSAAATAIRRDIEIRESDEKMPTHEVSIVAIRRVL